MKTTRPNTAETVYRFFCPGCRMWLIEGGVVHDDGECIHAPQRLSASWQVSHDNGQSWAPSEVGP